MTFTSKKPAVKIEDAILADFMELLDNQQLDNVWTKEWTSSKSQGHINFLTGHAYSGANPIILDMYQTLRGHTHSSLRYGVIKHRVPVICVY